MLNLTAKRANYLPIYISVTASSTNQRRTFLLLLLLLQISMLIS